MSPHSKPGKGAGRQPSQPYGADLSTLYRTVFRQANRHRQTSYYVRTIHAWRDSWGRSGEETVAYDVIVVGARCAGAPTAMLLARAGYRVLLLDRARFPRDTLSTLYIHQPGVALLARWNVLDAVRATGCPGIDEITFRVADITLTGSSEPVDGIGTAFAPRRHLLDQILVDAAVAAGAEFRDGCAVEELLFEDDRVVGIRCAGMTSGERARLVVGADGMRSTVAELVKAATQEDERLSCAYYSYWEGLSPRFTLHAAPGRWVGAVPTNDNLCLVVSYFPQAEFDRVRSDPRAYYLESIHTTAGDLYEQIRQAAQADRLHGTGDQRNFFRQAAGPGWALIGDAGHHKDSINARGITDALHQAQWLVDCVGGHLTDEARLREALRRFAHIRDERLIDDYGITRAAARLEVPRQTLAVFRVVAADPHLTKLYFSSVSGVRPIDDLYTTELLEAVDASLSGSSLSAGADPRVGQ